VSSEESNEASGEDMSRLKRGVVGAVMHWNYCLDCAYFSVFDHDEVIAPIYPHLQRSICTSIQPYGEVSIPVKSSDGIASHLGGCCCSNNSVPVCSDSRTTSSRSSMFRCSTLSRIPICASYEQRKTQSLPTVQFRASLLISSHRSSSPGGSSD
jgi:hypothetical protein